MFSVKQIVNNADLLQDFQDFCDTQHARENIDFWLAVENFKSTIQHSTVLPPTSPSPTPCAAATADNGASVVNRERTGSSIFSDSLDGNPPVLKKRATLSSSFRNLMMPRTVSKHRFLQQRESSLPPQVLAQRIFNDFLEPSSPRWVCHDHRISDALKLKLELGERAEATWFDAIQQKVFMEMEKDVVVRFNQAYANTTEQDKFGATAADESALASPQSTMSTTSSRSHRFSISSSPQSNASPTTNSNLSTRGGSTRFFPATMQRVSRAPSNLYLFSTSSATAGQQQDDTGE